jgi:hypothetical protein
LENEGYVPPVSARHFFELCEMASLEELAQTQSPDPISQIHFRNLSPAAFEIPLDEKSLKGSEKLNSLLLKAAMITPIPHALLSSSETRVEEGSVIAYLKELSVTNPQKFNTKLSELAFLGNTLVAGHAPETKKSLSTTEAAELAIKTLEKGFEYLSKSTGRSISEMVVKDSLIKVFRIGWKLTRGERNE